MKSVGLTEIEYSSASGASGASRGAARRRRPWQSTRRPRAASASWPSSASSGVPEASGPGWPGSSSSS